jgi:hypothetical protein
MPVPVNVTDNVLSSTIQLTDQNYGEVKKRVWG